ncbi:MAG: bifunctional folylpolyglutamate synthase/dihydrofolate synthase [Magnetococcus sp. YQC-5]
MQNLLKRRPSGTIRLGLVPVRRLLARMGTPHRDLNVVHVAGTNGKGSVIAFLESMLMAAGIPVAVFTSPHLIRFNERMRINGQEITDHALEALLTETLSYDTQEETTFFELTTAAALLYFARARLFGRHQHGLVLLETGLGGRLDATNVVVPRLCIITSIGLDHMDFLGPTLAGIAREKAGIMQPGVPTVAAPGSREATRMVSGVAARLGVPLYLLGRDFNVSVPDPAVRSQVHWRFRDGTPPFRLPPPALPGAHQYVNAALALAGAKLLRKMGYVLANADLAKGIATARWPGRLECFPGTPPVWLDGAHNPDAIMALVRFLRDSAMGQPVFTTLIFSVLNNKDAQAMVRLLVPWVNTVFLVACGGDRQRPMEELVAMWPSGGPSVRSCQNIQEALDAARSILPVGRVVVTGSLFLVGEARSILKSKNQDLGGR